MKCCPDNTHTAFERPLLARFTADDPPSNVALPPLAHPAAPRLTEPLAGQAFPDRILFVDDDPDVRDLTVNLLRHARYRVSCAEDGEAAWDALCADRFDLLITDQDMPRLKGLDLLRRVRAGRLPIPVILISGRMPWAETDLLRLLPPGIALEKPFSFNDLLANVRHISTPAILAGPLSERQTPGDFARHQPPARTTAGQSDGRTGTPVPGFVRAS